MENHGDPLNESYGNHLDENNPAKAYKEADSILNTINFGQTIFSKEDLNHLIKLFNELKTNRGAQIKTNNKLRTLIEQISESNNNIDNEINILTQIIDPNCDSGKLLWYNIILYLDDKTDEDNPENDDKTDEDNHENFKKIGISIIKHIYSNKSIKGESLFEFFNSFNDWYGYYTEYYTEICTGLKSRFSDENLKNRDENINYYVQFVANLCYNKEGMPNKFVSPLLVEIAYIQENLPEYYKKYNLDPIKVFLLNKSEQQ